MQEDGRWVVQGGASRAALVEVIKGEVIKEEVIEGELIKEGGDKSGGWCGLW
jgi:hypothetical protein